MSARTGCPPPTAGQHEASYDVDAAKSGSKAEKSPIARRMAILLGHGGSAAW